MTEEGISKNVQSKLWAVVVARKNSSITLRNHFIKAQGYLMNTGGEAKSPLSAA